MRFLLNQILRIFIEGPVFDTTLIQVPHSEREININNE